MQTERSGKQYTHLSAEERAVLMVMLDEKHSLRGIAARLGRAPSTLSRELARTLDTGARGAAAPPTAQLAQAQSGLGAVRRRRALAARGLVSRADCRQA